MPQIANQDYNIVKVTSGLLPNTDAAVIVALMKAYQQGTIFDVIVEDTHPTLRRVVAADAESIGLANTDVAEEIGIEHTLPQYEGLAAIQAAAIAQGLDVVNIPQLILGQSDTGFELGCLLALGGAIVDEDGNVYSITVNAVGGVNNITAVQKTQHAPEYVGWDAAPITVHFEEVQKLIGLPVTEY